jgi:hypothetical protein
MSGVGYFNLPILNQINGVHLFLRKIYQFESKLLMFPRPQVWGQQGLG